MQYSFPKAEKVTSKKEVEFLFGKARKLRHQSLSMHYFWKEDPDSRSVQRILIVVPKRRFKLAVDRNRIKRQLREVYRLNKPIRKNLDQQSNKVLVMAVIYTGSPKPRYHILAESFKKIIAKIPELTG